jgi:hypothetical protein
MVAGLQTNLAPFAATVPRGTIRLYAEFPASFIKTDSGRSPQARCVRRFCLLSSVIPCAARHAMTRCRHGTKKSAMGPASAQQHFVLQHARDDSGENYNPAGECEDNFSPTQGFMKEFIGNDEFSKRRFNLWVRA